MIMSSLRRSVFIGLVAILACAGCASPSEDTEPGSSEVALSGTLVEAPMLNAGVAFQRYHESTPTLGSEIPRRAKLSLTMHVRDHVVRQDRPAFDGRERAFALVPKLVAGQLRWERIDLAYLRSVEVPLAWYRRDAYDLHHVDGNSNRELDVDVERLALIQREGVAFGIVTNVGTVTAPALARPREESPLRPPI
jgi:hypothetical protein